MVTYSSSDNISPIFKIGIVAQRFDGGDDGTDGFILRNEVRREDLLELGWRVVSAHDEHLYRNVPFVGCLADVRSANEELENLVFVFLEAAGDANDSGGRIHGKHLELGDAVLVVNRVDDVVVGLRVRIDSRNLRREKRKI